MTDRILIQCPHCSTRLSIVDENKLGKRIRCSKCSEVFVAKAIKAAGSKNAKPKKSREEKFDFDDMEMEDSSMYGHKEPSGGALPARSQKGPKSRGGGRIKSSGGKIPLMIAGAISVVLLVGTGGYFFFREGKPDQVLSASQGKTPNSTGADLPDLLPAAPSQNPGMPSTAAVPALPAAKSKEAEKLGETAAVPAINVAELPDGVKNLSARTRWYWTKALDIQGACQAGYASGTSDVRASSSTATASSRLTDGKSSRKTSSASPASK